MNNPMSVGQLDMCLAAVHDELARLQSGGHSERPSVRAKIKACLERITEIRAELDSRKTGVLAGGQPLTGC